MMIYIFCAKSMAEMCSSGMVLEEPIHNRKVCGLRPKSIQKITETVSDNIAHSTSHDRHLK